MPLDIKKQLFPFIFWGRKHVNNRVYLRKDTRCKSLSRLQWGKYSSGSQGYGLPVRTQQGGGFQLLTNFCNVRHQQTKTSFHHKFLNLRQFSNGEGAVFLLSLLCWYAHGRNIFGFLSLSYRNTFRWYQYTSYTMRLSFAYFPNPRTNLDFKIQDLGGNIPNMRAKISIGHRYWSRIPTLEVFAVFNFYVPLLTSLLLESLHNYLTSLSNLFRFIVRTKHPFPL